MINKKFVLLILFILNCISFSQIMIEEQNNIPTTENFIMDYNLIDIIPLEPEKTNFIISNDNQNNNKKIIFA